LSFLELYYKRNFATVPVVGELIADPHSWEKYAMLDISIHSTMFNPQHHAHNANT